MAKLTFYYGVMNAGKSQALLQENHKYQSQGLPTLILKPTIDERDGADFVVSRLGVRAPSMPVSPQDNIMHIVAGTFSDRKPAAVLVDEAQFFSPQQIRQLADVADDLDIPVNAYGLRTDFLGNLFPGSRALFEFADEVKELGQICFCMREARMNIRFDKNGFVMRDGDSIHIGDSEYKSVCRKHWKTVQHIEETIVNDVSELY